MIFIDKNLKYHKPKMAILNLRFGVKTDEGLTL